MRRITLVILATAFAVVLVACAKTENTSNSNSNSSTANKSTGTSGTSTTSTTSTTASAGDKIGIAECDDFIAKYESCTSKVPEMAREQYKSAMVQWKASWKKLAENPQTKGTLAAACKQAAEQQAAAWKMYGCAN
jgi:hypothetical protein